MFRRKKFETFPANEIEISGWLKRQLKIQADGLNGNLDKIWPDVRDSAWIGGTKEGWERVPYWLDGFIPLAFLLRDENLIARAKKYVDAIVAQQQSDGWICPCSYDKRADYDTWAVLLITKVLCLYYDCTGDEKVLESVIKCLKHFEQHMSCNTLRNWGAARWFEGLIAIYRIYDITGEKWLLTLAKKMSVEGFDWRKIFERNLLDNCTKGWEMFSHVVNIAMMMKSEALLSLFDENADGEEFADMAFEYLTKNHGSAIGHFNGDENLPGKLPIQGAELCSIVELMYSYEVIFAVTGNPKWLDRLELLAYNSLPATLTADMWAHQYVQMVNQVASYPMSKQPFRTNNNDAHLFGLEPHFGCCTANFGQGFPKFAMSVFMKAEDGIAACAIAPETVNTKINGVKVSLECITDYPFKNTVRYIVKPEKEAEFTFYVRIPYFAAKAKLDGKETDEKGLIKIKRNWADAAEVKLEFEFDTEIVKRPNNMVCLRRGPLFYSIPVKGQKEKVEYWRDGVERKFPYCDYFIYPISKWNYALAGTDFAVKEKFVAQMPFDTENPPVTIEADVAEVEWGFGCGHCDPMPKSNVPISEKKKIEFVPYGCTELRITEIPIADNK